MIDNFEFSDTKQVRKTLLITSFGGIGFKLLLSSQSKGDIKFLGFEIPIENAHIIPSLVGCVIIYEMIVLIIRSFAEDVDKTKTRKKQFLDDLKQSLKEDVEHSYGYTERYKWAEEYYQNNKTKTKISNTGVPIIDFYFPLIFGLCAAFFIFFINVSNNKSMPEVLLSKPKIETISKDKKSAILTKEAQKISKDSIKK